MVNILQAMDKYKLFLGQMLLGFTVIKLVFQATPILGIEKTPEIPLFFSSSLSLCPEIEMAVRIQLKSDFEYESSDLITQLLYRVPSRLYHVMAASGANGINVLWEQNKTEHWYIEAQRTGEEAIIGGLLKNDEAAIEAGFKMFDWAFSRQAPDGSFVGTAGYFHSHSFFVHAVARTLLFIEQSPQSKQYAELVAHYTPLVHRAARWMIAPEVWNRGIQSNHRYTHRYYLVATAVGLTGKLTGDLELIFHARELLEAGLSLQLPNGVNPEKGGYDSSYQMAGIMYAARWVSYFPDDPLTPQLREMIDKALAWEESRILDTGEISIEGNTRTAGQEIRLTGEAKGIDARTAFRGFAYWAAVTGNSRWEANACKIAEFYYNLNPCKPPN